MWKDTGATSLTYNFISNENIFQNENKTISDIENLKELITSRPVVLHFPPHLNVTIASSVLFYSYKWLQGQIPLIFKLTRGDSEQCTMVVQIRHCLQRGIYIYLFY
jgi:hypothetical protein